MATLAQIMRVRKIALRNIAQRMRIIDTAQETIERYIKRLIKRRNKLPQVSEMQKIIQSMSLLDRAEGKLIEACNSAIRVFEESADIAGAQTGKITAITPKDLTRLGRDLSRFLTNMSEQLPTHDVVGIGSEKK